MTLSPVSAARVLVVEDELIALTLLKYQLVGLGYEIAGKADTGEEAIKQATALQPDIVLMDINLKGEMDGIEAARAIRSSCEVPVIFLTASASDRNINRARTTEPFGYLLKPLSHQHLRTSIEIALYKGAMERERARLTRELQEALAKVKTLGALLPICAWCRDVRNDDGYWEAVENFIQRHSATKFSHGICPKCTSKHFRSTTQTLAVKS